MEERSGVGRAVCSQRQDRHVDGQPADAPHHRFAFHGPAPEYSCVQLPVRVGIRSEGSPPEQCDSGLRSAGGPGHPHCEHAFALHADHPGNRAGKIYAMGSFAFPGDGDCAGYGKCYAWRLHEVPDGVRTRWICTGACRPKNTNCSGTRLASPARGSRARAEMKP